MPRVPDFRHEELIPRRPHRTAPTHASVRCIFVNHRSGPGSGAGLGVTVRATAKVLDRAGIHTNVWNSGSAEQLNTQIEKDQYAAARPITHIVINTFNIILPKQLQQLAEDWPDIRFVQLNHTGLAYMCIDDNGPQRIRKVLDLQMSMPNITVAGNNPRFGWFGLYGIQPVILPNLYDVESFVMPVAHRRDHDPMRIGTFGENRPWKNFADAAQAALSIAKSLGVQLELYVNTDRWQQTWGYTRARAELFAGLTWAKIIQVPWQDWMSFRHIVSTVDLCINPSFDETFCSVVADAIAVGVPCVTSGCIEWSPPSWQAPQTFAPASVAATGMALLHSQGAAVHDGRQALISYVDVGTAAWIKFLTA